MSVQIFLGEPPAQIKAWIIAHAGGEEPDPVDESNWGKVVAALEDCKPTDFNNLNYTGSNPVLIDFAVGAGTKSVSYKLDGTNPVDTLWLNLGFNGSVPEYVKYRTPAKNDGWKHIWIKSMKDGFIAPIATNDATYVRTFDDATADYVYTVNEDKVIEEISETMFSYGNKNTYSVPTQITVDGKQYDFCGYNLTLNSQACLEQSVFNSASNNRYSISPLHTKLSDITVDGSIIGKIADENFMKNISRAVNRTWVHSSWRDGATLDSNFCEHVVDRIWLLGSGHVNGDSSWTQSNLQDVKWETSEFAGVFIQKGDTAAPSKIKYKVNADGSTGSSASSWWLRSANSYSGSNVGFVSANGELSSYNDSSNSLGVSPAVVIG